MRIVLCFAASLVMLTSLPASAGFILEPYVGTLVSSDFTETSNDQSLSGFEFGTRLGFSNFGLSYGLDANSGLLETDSSSNANITPTRIGGFLGFNPPILPQVILTYYATSKMKFDYASAGTPDRTYDGTAFRAALIFSPIPFLRIGVEYLADTFDSYEASSATTNLNPEVTHKSWLLTLGISLP